MSLSVKSKSSLTGAFIFLGLTIYSAYQGSFDTQAILAFAITIYFLVAALLGVKSRTTMLIRVVIISSFLIYVISVYVR